MRKRFGQHFLQDQSIVTEILRYFTPKPQDSIIEIGAGAGALTLPLLRCHSPLTVIEIDDDLIPILQQQTQSIGQLNIIHQDVLQVNFASLLSTNNSLRLIGNLPYNISTPLFFHLLKYKSIIQDMCFMVQQEVALRLTAMINTAAYSRLSIMIQRDFTVDYLFLVPPKAFDPPPKVNSAMIYLKPRFRSVMLYEMWFKQIVTQAFQQRRKMLRNTLAHYFSVAELITNQIDPCARAAELSIDDYTKLAHFYGQKQEGVLL